MLVLYKVDRTDYKTTMNQTLTKVLLCKVDWLSNFVTNFSFPFKKKFKKPGNKNWSTNWCALKRTSIWRHSFALSMVDVLFIKRVTRADGLSDNGEIFYLALILYHCYENASTISIRKWPHKQNKLYNAVKRMNKDELHLARQNIPWKLFSIFTADSGYFSVKTYYRDIYIFDVK